MSPALTMFEVTPDHPVPISPQGGTATVTVLSGDTLYYADTPQVSAAHNQGSVTAGNVQSFTNPAWVRSASLSTVLAQVTAATVPPGSAALSSDGTRTSVLNGPSGVGLRDIVSAKDAPWNAMGDGRAFGACSITAGSAVLTCTANLFQATDVGKTVTVMDAGASGDSFTTTILSFQSTGQVTLSAPVTTTVSSVSVWIGTDDTSALQSFINYLISTGERGIIPRGNYVTTAALDFSGMRGSYLGAACWGQGVGAFNSNWDSATNIWCAYPGTAVQGFGGAGSNLVGLKIGGFAIKCLHLLGAANWAFYFDVLQNCQFDDIAVQGYVTHGGSFSQAGQGNGVWINNMPQGQVTIRRVHAEKFADATNGSEGWRFGAKTTTHATAANSGNSTMEACISDNCHHGFHFAADALTNGCTFTSLKATSSGGVQTGSAYIIDGLMQNNTFNAPHGEGFATGYYFNGAIGNVLNGPLASYTSATLGDGSAAFKFDNSAKGNEIRGAESGTFDIGTLFVGTNTMGNVVRARFSAAPLTTKTSYNGNAGQAGNNDWRDLDFPGASIALTSSTATSPASAAAVAIPWNAENFKYDVAGAASLHSTTTNNTRVTVPMAGRWRVLANVGFASSATGQRQVGIRKNGTTYQALAQIGANGSGVTNIGVGQVIGLAAGDYIEITVYQDSGAALALTEAGGYGLPNLYMEYIGP